MSNRSVKHSIFVGLMVVAAPIVAGATTPIVVLTVPWIPATPTTPHSSWIGNQTTLKGTANVQDNGSNTIVYDWNPGDGGTHCTGTVTNQAAIECPYTYTTGSIGTVYNAVLTVYDNTTGTGAGGTAPYSNTSSASYFVEIFSPPPNLPVEVNASIDAGLWFLHKGMQYGYPGGAIGTVTLTNPGQNYELTYDGAGTEYCCSDVSVNITGSGGSGSGASATANLDTDSSSPTFGQITSLTIDNPGSGYVAPVTFTASDNYCAYKIYYGYGPTDQCGTGFAATATASAVGTYANEGYWSVNNYAGVAANNCNAFEVSGHLESGPASDPYTGDVHACLQYVFSLLQSTPIDNVRTNTHGSYNPDSNANGLGVHEVDGQSQDQYQSGMMIDVVTASGTPNQPVTTGPLASLTHPGNASQPYTYKDAVIDMVDYDIWCESANGSTTNQGSWVYGCQPSGGDNSVAQWVAIGLISGIRDFGATVPTNAKLGNQDWLNFSQAQGFGGSGFFGYSDSSPIWGPYATTPAGMVELAFNGIGRSPTATCCDASTNSSATQWDWAETFMRDNFDTPQTYTAGNDVKDYYYGLFSFTKSMLLHDNSGTGTTPTPITNLRSLDNAAKPAIDWYAAQDATWGGSDTSNGVARTLVSGTSSAENGGSPVSGQNSDGSWNGHDFTEATSQFNTAWAIIMLNRTVTQIQPTACITPVGPTGQDGSVIHISGGCSNTTDPNKTIVSWQWDVSCTAGGGTNFTQTGVNLNFAFTEPGAIKTYPYNCPARLRVTDSGGLTADLVFNDVITAPNGVVPPVANVGGPYSFCKNITPWYFDGSQTTQQPPATISSYNWDYSCSNTFTSSHVVQPRVDTGANNVFGQAPGSYCVALQVINSASEANSQTTSYTIHSATDAQCSDCVSSLVAKAKNSAPGNPGNVQLYWYDTNSSNLPIDHYNVYRSPNADFSNFVVIAGQGGSFNSVPVPAVKGSQIVFIDTTAQKTGTYYYRVSPATANDSSTCSSPITLAATVGGRN